MAQNQVFQVAMHFLMPLASEAINVFYLQQSSAGTPSDTDIVSDMADYIDVAYATIAAAMDSEIIAGEAQVFRRNTAEDTWDGIGGDFPSVTPSANQEMISHGVSMVLQAATSVAKSSGTKFLFGFGEQNIAQSVWENAILASAAGFLANWIAPFVTGTLTYTPGIWSVVGNTFLPFVGTGVVNTLAGYQRRRKPGVGI